MTAFEYFSVMVSVILAFGISHILAAIGITIQRPRAARLYWVHSLWVLILLAVHFSAWWNIWGMRDQLRFTYFSFLFVLIGPLLLFLASRVLVPGLGIARNVDFEQHYFAVHRSFFTMLAAFIVWPILLANLVLNRSITWPGLLSQIVYLLPVLACLVSTNRTVHGVGTALTVVVFIGLSIVGYT